MLLAAKRIHPQKLLTQFSSQEGWIWAIVVGISVIVMFAVILKLKEWFRKSQLQTSKEDLLLAFRDIHRQGELSADEYRSIRERLTKKSDETGRAGDVSQGLSSGDSVGSSSAATE